MKQKKHCYVEMIFHLLIFSATVFATSAYALTPEEILLLKRSGVSDEKIMEMQKKGEAVSLLPQPSTLPPINAFDWNEDGKKDIITGSDSGKIYVYLNTGKNKEPVFDNAIEILNVEVEDGESTPYVVDWNNDGRKDILAGSGPGEVSIFINRGTNLQPMFDKEKKINAGNLDVGFSSSPAMADWNGDGKKDLVVGNRSGKVFVFINFINNKSPTFQTDADGIETSIKVSGNATPFIVDWNNDGRFDVVSGSSDGKVYIFINEGDSKNPKFSKPQTVQVNGKELKLPNSTSVIALDWDDDGKTDLLVSNKEKNQLGMYILLNTGTKEKPEFKELKQIKGKFRDDAAL
jgi:WD40 repeat protein